MSVPGHTPSVAANVDDVLPKVRVRLGTDPSGGASRDASSDVGVPANDAVDDAELPAPGIIGAVSRRNAPAANAAAAPNTTNATRITTRRCPRRGVGGIRSLCGPSAIRVGVDVGAVTVLSFSISRSHRSGIVTRPPRNLAIHGAALCPGA